MNHTTLFKNAAELLAFSQKCW